MSRFHFVVTDGDMPYESLIVDEGAIVPGVDLAQKHQKRLPRLLASVQSEIYSASTDGARDIFHWSDSLSRASIGEAIFSRKCREM